MIFPAPPFDDLQLNNVAAWDELDTYLPPVLVGQGELNVESIYANATLYVINAMYGETRVLMYHGPPFHFRYWIWDEGSSTISHYEGEYGDPEMDKLLSEDLY